MFYFALEIGVYKNLKLKLLNNPKNIRVLVRPKIQILNLFCSVNCLIFQLSEGLSSVMQTISFFFYSYYIKLKKNSYSLRRDVVFEQLLLSSIVLRVKSIIVFSSKTFGRCYEGCSKKS